jgi:hypothetical protein
MEFKTPGAGNEKRKERTVGKRKKGGGRKEGRKVKEGWRKNG